MSRVFVAWLLFCAAMLAPAKAAPPEDVYRGALVSFPGAWSFQIPKSAIILVSDQELEALSDPDHVLNLSLSRTPENTSLRQICERARAGGQRTLILAFDHFFKQYRPGQETPRQLMPDMDAYVARIAAISRFAAQYGLGLELSLLSPLEIGKAYTGRTGESGLWMHYREGLRDPVTGAFSVEMWQQERWANNKGPINLEDAGVRVFAFHESAIPGTLYRVVDPKSIVELTGVSRAEPTGSVVHSGEFQARRVRISGRISTRAPGLDRVLVVQQYRTPEMDYFSPKALPFLEGLVDKYAAAGVRLNGLYSDEMHIQQDGSYFAHHDEGEFCLRYVSPGLAHAFAARYGAEYQDFAKYLVYFAYGQEDFANDLSAKQGTMHVFGSSPEEISRTALFRARYYRLLQDGVVDLFVQAKHYAEGKMGHRLESRAHATWAESPTIDDWNTGRQNRARNQYEYTSNFVWSNTVQQAAAACDDYFKWGDFLTGNGNDHAEGGWLDRDYYALALAASTGILNDVPNSYAAHWGLPDAIGKRRQALVDVFGDSASLPFAIVEDAAHRDSDVLTLYPLDLVAVEERFGSWMTQYGYTNYVTSAKLLERGHVTDGAIEMAGRRFRTLVAAFEPFPSEQLLKMMRQFAASGGRVIWSGPPPLVTFEGRPALPLWEEIFGAVYTPAPGDGLIAPGKLVRFEGPFAKVAPQVILTDFLVDRIYPVRPKPGTVVAARVKEWIAGTRRAYPGGGSAVFLGYRPRDDQSHSLGYDARNWFEVLDALDAYPATGRFAGVNDNPERLSRLGAYLAARFPNGTVAIAPHLREYEEGWQGGFVRNAAADRAYLEHNPPPSEAIHLRDYKVNGHSVTYDGAYAVAFRTNEAKELLGFAGRACREIVVDGRRTVFAPQPLDEVAWAPVPPERRVPGGALLQLRVVGTGAVRIPVEQAAGRLALVEEGPAPGSRGASVPSRRENGALVFTITPALSGKWIYATKP